jgi:hypothetical protein
MADEQLFEQIVGTFNYNEPTEEELNAELEKLTGIKNTRDESPPLFSRDSFASVVAPDDCNVEHVQITEEDSSNPDLVKELERLGLSESSNSSSSLVADTRIATRDELKTLALKAKREGRLEEAKEYLCRLRAVDNVTSDEVDQKISTVDKILINSSVSKSSDDPRREIKLKALALKKTGDIQGALNMLKSLKESPSKVSQSANLKLKYKSLFDHLDRQARLCEEASIYFNRIKDHSNAKIFSDRKKACEKDVKYLLSELKAENEPPKGNEVAVTFETQAIDEQVKERDLVVSVDTNKCTLPCELSDYKIKVVFELPTNGPVQQQQQEKIIRLTPSTATHTVTFENQITRDIRQQKFFEHRRCKFELILKEKTFLFFSNESVVANGHLKLQPLCTTCKLTSEVRLVDSVNKRHSCTVKVEIRLRHPISLKDPIKHKEQFIYFLENVRCGYSNNTTNTSTIFCSYVVLEKEIGRLSHLKDQPSQMRMIELEGMRDALQLQVQTGQLTIQDYLKRVQQCILDCRRQCLELKCQNQIDQAKALLVNIRLMEDEVREALEAEQENNEK